MKIVFMGTPEFGAIILEGIIKGGYKPILVVTAPDKPVGRKQVLTSPLVKVIAQKYQIPVLQPEKIQDTRHKIQDTKPDLIVVAAYGQILPKDILDTPKYGCLNVHPSLLPKYRGSSPIQAAILNGDKETGVTIILMDEKMDHGPILAKRELEIPNPKSQIPNKSQILNSKITYKELHNKLVELGTELLLETIPKWLKGAIKPKAQDESKATYTKILKKEDGKIDWRKSAEEIEKRIRAFFPWPGSYTFWEKSGKAVQIKILKARVFESPSDVKHPVGKTLVVPQNELGVQSGKGSLPGAGNFLVIERLQMEGGREMGSEEFLRGHSDFIGTILK